MSFLRMVLLQWGGLLILAGTLAQAAEVPAPGAVLEEAACRECHAQQHPALMEQWQQGPHREIDCQHCHGTEHHTAATQARHNTTCNRCHQGAVSHSYATSKHGVIAAIGRHRQDDSQPLQRGNYRAPGCAYCHLHDRDHGDTMDPERGPHINQWICSACHSPRYVGELFRNGQAQLAIADLKRAEGEELLQRATTPGQQQALTEAQKSLNKHRQHVLLGVGHQSPDYQWWHGQPALDGDLIRMRDALINTE